MIMNRALVISSLLLLLFTYAAKAQRVPDNILRLYEKVYSETYNIEKKILPDFTRPHPNQMNFYNQCYPGKRILVYALTAEKPKEWLFKISVGNQSITPKSEIQEIELEGKKYYTNFIIAGFPSNMNDKGDYCMNLIAYDGSNIDLPVYLYLFSPK
jgi:hypothetical protein